jgi:hypothetical protein
MLYYLYTVKLGMDEDSFFSSTLSKVVYLIEKWSEEQQRKAAALSGRKPQPSGTAHSIKEVMRNYGIK